MITRTRERILFFIGDFHKWNGYSPSFDEIREALGFASKSPIHYHMKRLRADGLIDYQDGQPRTVIIVKRGRE